MMRSARAMRWLLLAFLALAIAACDSGNSGDDDTTPKPSILRDPAARGPYAVGLQHITFTRITDDGEPRALDSWIWYPAEGASADAVAEDAAPADHDGPFPLVIFSHGSNGRPEYQRFFTEHLASWGYVVVAPPHPGNTLDDCGTCDISAVLASAPQRPVDVRFVIAELTSMNADPDSTLGAIIDTERVAVAGHSFGGWTSVFVATDDGIDAIIAMAPGAPQTLIGHASKIDIPVLMYASELDRVVDPAGVHDLGEAIPETAPLTFVSLPNGTHLTFIDRCFDCGAALPETRGHELTNRYAVAFLEYHLRGDARYLTSLTNSDVDALVTSR